jgi:hypothetical protein
MPDAASPAPGSTGSQNANGAGTGAAKDGIAPNAQASNTGAAAAVAANPAATAAADVSAQRLIALARRERALQHQREEFKRSQAGEAARLKAEAESLAKQRAEVEELRSWREKARSNPLDALKFLGHSYESVTEAQLNNGKVSPEQLVAIESERLKAENAKALAERDAKLKALEDRQSEWSKQQEMQAQQAQQQMENFRQNIVGWAKSEDGAKYEFIRAYGAEAKIADLIAQHHQQSYEADIPAARAEGRDPTGKVLSAQEAADMLEAWYDEQAKAIYGTKKFQSRFKAIEQQATNGANGAAAAAGTTAANNGTTAKVEFETKRGGVSFERTISGQRPTLTNAAVASPSPAAPAGPVSEQERMKRAIAVYDAVQAERRARAAQA